MAVKLEPAPSAAGNLRKGPVWGGCPRLRAKPVLAHGEYGFPHLIKLRHVYRDGQAAGKLLRQLLQRIGAASEQGDFRATIRQRDRPREADPG